jgi:hypothetical protein
LNEKTGWYNEIFDFIDIHHPDWEKLLVEDKVKIKTNQNEVVFAIVEKILQRFSLRIVNISFTDYYGIIIEIEKL